MTERNGGSMEDTISRKMAIDAIEKNAYRHTYLDQIIDIIKALPPAQPETHDKRTETHSCDCISRQAAIDYCYQLINVEYEQGSDEMNYGQERVNQTETILHHLENLPSAQPDLSGYSDKLWKAAYERGKAEAQRKKGKWLPDNNSLYEMRFVCSECHESEVVPTIGFTKYKPIWDFCPNCGADMREEGADETR